MGFYKGNLIGKETRFKKGHSVSDDIRSKVSLANIGKKHTEEHKERIREAMKGREITWGDKISKIQRTEEYKKNHGGIIVCMVCKKEVQGYTSTQKFCSKECQYKHNYKDVEPIMKKAMTISSPVVFGEGKRDFFYNLVKESLYKHCRYCGTILGLENISLDHIIPFGKTELRQSKLVQKQLNIAENLQIICRKCNGIKGNLSHEKFVKLLAFLDEDILLKDYIMKKLAQGNIMWSFKRKNKF